MESMKRERTLLDDSIEFAPNQHWRIRGLLRVGPFSFKTAEDGIRYRDVTGVQRVLFRSNE